MYFFPIDTWHDDCQQMRGVEMTFTDINSKINNKNIFTITRHRGFLKYERFEFFW